MQIPEARSAPATLYEHRPASYVAFTHEDPQSHEIYVLLRREHNPKNPSASSWGFPGGGSRDLRTFRLEAHRHFPYITTHKKEHPRRAAIRETREETGIPLRRRHLDLALSIVTAHPLQNTGTQGVNFYVARQHTIPFGDTPEIKQQLEAMGVQWFTRDQAQKEMEPQAQQAKQSNDQHQLQLIENIMDGVTTAVEHHIAHITATPLAEFISRGFRFRFLLQERDVKEFLGINHEDDLPQPSSV
jgi:8-oxo-dGTP pyrophosphatase MutT (NUDIX family)